MKILMINSVCGIGSTGRICTDLAAEFEAEGHEVKIAYGRSGYVPENAQKYAVRIGSDFDIRVNALKARTFDNEGLNAKAATRKFLNWAEEYNPELLWLHNLHGYYINYELLFQWIKTRPEMQVKWTLHDCWAFTGHCAHFTVAKCDKWKSGCVKCTQLKTYPISFGLDYSKQNYSIKKEAFTGVNNLTIITPSKWMANLVSESFLKEYPVEVHYNKIDADIFKPTPSDFRERYGLEDKKIVLGVAGVWSENKGLNDFIKLSEMLDEQYKIVLVGLSKKQIGALPSNVIGIERTESARQLAEIYTAADVCLNPTYEDNYPTVNLEAQACGTPVITYNTGGSPESVPAENVVECGDVNALAERIYEIT